MSKTVWKTGPAGKLSTEWGDFELLVQPVRKGSQEARYLLLQRREPCAPIASGTADSVSAAIEKCEQIAARWSDQEKLSNMTQPS